MLVKIEARILIFPGTDIHFPSTSVPPGTFFRLWGGSVGGGGLLCACVRGKETSTCVVRWRHLATANDARTNQPTALATVGYCSESQGRLNQWAHWARAQGPRIFFFLRGPQLAVVK